ncbi:MAG: hypothetical protein CME75_05645 [Halomonas sp.]|nr:hypothetical protein [Halomonas sp.]
MESDSSVTLAYWLKQETQADHHRVDHHPALRALLRPNVTMATYGAALACLYPAIAGLENALSQAIEKRNSRYALTLREPLLRHDLTQLNQPLLPAWCFAVPASVYEMVGMLYVLEGSRLGGEVIGRHAKRCLGEQIPCRFFTETPLTPAGWAGFWRFAEAICPSGSWPQILRGAQQAFSGFTKALTDSLPATATPPLTLAPTE